MINQPDRRYPGPGRPPTATDQGLYMRSVDALQQANPADGGTGGIGVDSGGTQFRDWATPTIIGRITGRGTSNAYSWVEVLVNTDGTHSDVAGGLSGNTIDNPAFEANGRTDVPATVVELWPNYSPEPFWTFVYDGQGISGSGGSGAFPDDRTTFCFEDLIDVGVVVTATCVSGIITTDTVVTKTFQTVCITAPNLTGTVS